MSQPIHALCTKPHGLPCLAHKDVIGGTLEPCEICAPHREKVRNLLSIKDVMQAGYGGMTKSGQLVDRREHPEATTIAANSLLNIGKPQPVKA